MRTMHFSQAVDDALAQAMAKDERILLMGEDVPLLRRNLLVRFGPKRVMGAPISESAFLGAGAEFKPEGAERPLKTNRKMRHAPAHPGCNCLVIAGRVI